MYAGVFLAWYEIRMRRLILVGCWGFVVAFTECGHRGNPNVDSGTVARTCEQAVALGRSCSGTCMIQGVFCTIPTEGCDACLSAGARMHVWCEGETFRAAVVGGACDLDASVATDAH